MRCPKRMLYGPCGGVDAAGACEVPGVGRCAFLDVPAPGWPSAGVAAPAPLAALLATRPVVLTDLPARALSADSLRRSAATLAGASDAVLMGDHPQARVQFPPSFRSLLAAREGAVPWPVLTCRDRNRVALEAELAALAVVRNEAALAGVHCVTGDHPTRGHRPDAAAVFDLDSARLVALAAAAGLPVSVGEAPANPPGPVARAHRLRTKVAAGAGLCVVDHAGGTETVEEFVAAARAAGVDVPFLACVPVVTSAESAAVLRSFPGLSLPAGYLEGIVAAPDPRVAGVAAAVGYAERLLAVPGIAGVNLSGVALPEDLAAIGRALLPA